MKFPILFLFALFGDLITAQASGPDIYLSHALGNMDIRAYNLKCFRDILHVDKLPGSEMKFSNGNVIDSKRAEDLRRNPHGEFSETDEFEIDSKGHER